MRYLLLLFLIGFTFQVDAQSINTEFGKNRIQYHDDFKNWWMYETENFITHWYGKGRNVAISTIQLAEYDFDEIQSLLEHRFNEKIEIVVYTDLTDLKQSNIGTEETFVNTTGQTKVIGNKLFIYFDGDHQNLRKQIRAGVTGVFLNSMLFGSSLQEIVQNAVLLNIPEWFSQGIVRYLSAPWTVQDDQELRQIMNREKRKYKDFDRIARDYPGLVGHSFWNYIHETYGSSSLSNLLYLTRINRSVESGFSYVIGSSYEEVSKEWFDFYKSTYQADKDLLAGANVDDLIYDSKRCEDEVTEVAISPENDLVVYATNDIGKVKIRLHDLKSGVDKKIFKYGFRNSFQETDHNYPIISWTPRGNEVSIIYENKDVVKQKIINPYLGKEEEILFDVKLQRVYSADFISAEDMIVSGNVDGFSDLFIYDVERRVSERITHDFWDDLDARSASLNGNKGVIFSSNRKTLSIEKQKIDTTLAIDNFDLYFLDLERKALQRLTNTPNISERSAKQINEKQIVYLSDENGILNEKILTQNEDGQWVSQSLSNHSHNVEAYDLTEELTIYSHKTEKRTKLYKAKTNTASNNPIPYTYLKKTENQKTGETQNEILFGKLKGEEKNKVAEIDPGLKFQSRFPDPEKPEVADAQDNPNSNEPGNSSAKNRKKNSKTVLRYNTSRAVASRLKFKLDHFTSQLDNSVLFEGLDSYAGQKLGANTGGGGTGATARRDEYQNTPVGVLTKASVKDLFEDYIVEGGFRIPTSANGSEYYLVFDDRKHRLDKRYALYRRAQIEREEIFTFPIERNKLNTLIALYQLRYPLNIYSSFRGSTTLRFDRFLYQSSDAISFNSPVSTQQRLGLKLEYVYDNSHELDLNILEGTRAKVYVEGVNRFNMQLTGPFIFEPSNGFMTILGFDYRKYISLDKRSILAFRAAGATSFGSERIMYYLGGMENWIFPQFNQNIPIPQDDVFAYKAVAANVRGFQYNVRNGSSFSLLNAELRVPVFQYFFKRKIRYAFFRNFQVVPFFDAGMAWHGLTPYSDQNPLNTSFLENPPTVFVKVNYFRDPIVMGYGLGFRSVLFGYFIKLDFARGIETRRVQDQRIYLTFGTDF